MKIDIPIPKNEFKVESRSHKGEFHKVYEMSDGTWRCDCWAYWGKKKKGLDCYHIIKAKNYERGKISSTGDSSQTNENK